MEMMRMKEKISEEWNKPDWIQVDSEHFRKLEENNENYETVIEEIIDIINSAENSDQKIKDIKEAIDNLQEKLYYV